MFATHICVPRLVHVFVTNIRTSVVWRVNASFMCVRHTHVKQYVCDTYMWNNICTYMWNNTCRSLFQKSPSKETRFCNVCDTYVCDTYMWNNTCMCRTHITHTCDTTHYMCATHTCETRRSHASNAARWRACDTIRTRSSALQSPASFARARPHVCERTKGHMWTRPSHTYECVICIHIRKTRSHVSFRTCVCKWRIHMCAKGRVHMCDTIHARSTIHTRSSTIHTTGLFCKRALKKRRYSAKETCEFREPTNDALIVDTSLDMCDTIDTGLFCQRALQKRRDSAKETYKFREPTNDALIVSHMSSDKSFVGSLNLYVSFAESRLFWRALLQKRPVSIVSCKDLSLDLSLDMRATIDTTGLFCERALKKRRCSAKATCKCRHVWSHTACVKSTLQSVAVCCSLLPIVTRRVWRDWHQIVFQGFFAKETYDFRALLQKRPIFTRHVWHDWHQIVLTM